MSDTLFRYYEGELRFVRQLAQEFAKQYPAVAGRLGLEENVSRDPHVERLIESFALLTARVQHKLDDEFPELTDALLGILYPHYLAPVPSMAVLQFDLDPARVALPDGFRIDRHSPLQTRQVDGLPCRFRTGYPVTLWPVAITAAKLRPPSAFPGIVPPPRTKSVLSLTVECQSELPFAGLSLETLRLCLTGDDPLIANLYELILNQTVQVLFRPLDGPQRPVLLSPSRCLSPVGFGRDEGLLEYPNQSFLGYRLLTEFFAFPGKFLFVDLGGWAEVRAAGFGRRLEVLLFLGRELSREQRSLELGVDAQTFRLGCTPVVNLFEQTAEPIKLTRKQFEYRVTPDVHYPDGMEVYALDGVSHTDPETGRTTEYRPFYSFRHEDRGPGQAYWYAARRPSPREGDRGTDVYLNLVDLDFDPRLPVEPTLIVRTTCLNRDLPSLLRQAGQALSFELLAAAPLHGIQCVRSPTATLRPPGRRGAHWRLISHLSLNHLSIADAKEGLSALQEYLRLYDFADAEADPHLSAVTRQCIEGMLSLRSRRVVGRTDGETASGYARGIEIALELDEQKYVGTGAYLFASVLERFLGLYVSINSFSQLVVRTRQSEGILKRWPPRAGDLPLL